MTTHDPEPTPSSITVTKPSLPPLEEYVALLRDIWDRRWLTNRGNYHEAFERALAQHLGVPHVSLFCNGTMALQVALQALRISGEVITTPFSFPATTHAIYWNHCTPVFCDIDPESCNLDPKKVESLITPRTTAILPVHVYGNPCDVEHLQKIADTYGLRLIYDAAHAFGVRKDGRSVLSHGDVSVMSFHATKVFTTAEGGALVVGDAKLKQRIDYLKNFGFADELTVVGPGVNGKMNELQAALGLLQLKYVDGELEKRHRLVERYRAGLEGIPGIRLMRVPRGITHNDAYQPIFIDADEYGVTRDALYAALRRAGIYARRYFFPLISEFPTYRDLPSANAAELPHATRVARSVLCLPLYAGLSSDEVDSVCGIVRQGKPLS